MNEDKTTLNRVREGLRTDGEVMLKTSSFEDAFIFRYCDETLQLGFSDVSAYIEYGSEWADFSGEDVNLTLCNERNNMWPHWVFEEFHHIEEEGELRPVDDYETTYQLKDNRGIKGR